MSMRGVRVLELGAYIAAPLATKFMGDLGATVLKVEPPDGDPARRWGSSSSVSPWFAAYNLGKESVTLDLEGSESDRNILETLLSRADVVVTNLSASYRTRIGLAATLVTRHPQIVFCCIEPSREETQARAFDSLAQATTGVCGMVGTHSPSFEPGYLPFPVADVMTAHAAVSACLLGLLKRAQTGKGGVVQTDLCSPVATLMIEALALQPDKTPAEVRTDRLALAQVYFLRAMDKKWIVAHLSSKQLFWEGFCESLEIAPDLANLDQASRRARYEEILFAARSRAATLPIETLTQLFRKSGLPFSLVPFTEETLESILEPYSHTGGTYRSVRFPVRTETRMSDVTTSPPEHRRNGDLRHLSSEWIERNSLEYSAESGASHAG